MSIFPIITAVKSLLKAVMTEPRAATARREAEVHLGPNLSARRPAGICMAAYVQKYIELRNDTFPPSSSMMSPPTTLTDTLWK